MRFGPLSEKILLAIADLKHQIYLRTTSNQRRNVAKSRISRNRVTHTGGFSDERKSVMKRNEDNIESGGYIVIYILNSYSIFVLVLLERDKDLDTCMFLYMERICKIRSR